MFKKIRYYIASKAMEEAKDPKTGMPALIKSCGIKLLELRENAAEIVNDADGSVEEDIHIWVCESSVWRFNWFKLRYGYWTKDEYNLNGVPTLVGKP